MAILHWSDYSLLVHRGTLSETLQGTLSEVLPRTLQGTLRQVHSEVLLRNTPGALIPLLPLLSY